MDRKYRLQLIDFYKSLMEISEEDLSALFSRLDQKRFKKGMIIKEAGKIDQFSRFVCEGLIGLYREKDGTPNLEYLFTTGDIATEFHSYYTNQASEYYLKTLNDGVYIELSADSQEYVAKKNHNLMKLESKVMSYIMSRRTEMNGIRLLGLEAGYRELTKYLGDYIFLLKQTDLAGLFNCSLRKVSRWYSEKGSKDL
ncbi:hypothetical protein [Algoriphagus winogradskyi]|uniref:cAMP-binding domain of CRP or a regulatory subunit of cAMP-dependent protein kinases n=1 Tax=Algoriphagus winogradskyi TaxID=237017 RepID=A0ABY1NXK2_9BACT|nr:hypothetical protein [Algoriphagus winogradskyi]SMP19459.1 cAMP-binding domain of CRP or a regulatory subunit of cAMP-dependent protein kinases [Algoriphagus winogradskyi]